MDVVEKNTSKTDAIEVRTQLVVAVGSVRSNNKMSLGTKSTFENMFCILESQRRKHVACHQHIISDASRFIEIYHDLGTLSQDVQRMQQRPRQLRMPQRMPCVDACLCFGADACLCFCKQE